MKHAFLPFALALSLAPACGLASAQNKPQTTASSSDVHSYRLTYTLSETDGDRKIGVQHFVLTVDGNNPRPASVKIGSKIPVVTGGRADPTALKPDEYQVTYLDVGLNISAQLTEASGTLQLTSKVEQSSVIDAANTPPVHPVIRQTVLANDAVLKPGGTVQLGSIDIPGSTRHLDVTVHVERVD